MSAASAFVHKLIHLIISALRSQLAIARALLRRPRPLTLSLIFHMNQEHCHYAEIAYKYSYLPALSLLIDHTAIPFALHISGPILEFLEYRHPSMIALIKKGISDNRIELLGSTFSQAIPHCLDAYSADMQIKLHKQQIERIFGITPRGFWVPERVITRETLQLAAQNGYTYAPLESLSVNHAPGTALGCSFKLLTEDKHFSHLFNYYLAGAYGFSALWCFFRRGISGSFTLLAEDMESIGLWHFEKGQNAKEGWKRFLKFIRYAENNPCIVTTLPSFLVDSGTNESDILQIRQAAQWMNDALQGKVFQFHETEKYTDWFDFSEHAPRIREFSALFASISKELQHCKNKCSPELAAFLNEIKLMFARHQYEFGCIGINGTNKALWERSCECFLLIHAFSLAADKNYGVFKKDDFFCAVFPDYICIIGSDSSVYHLYSLMNNRFVSTRHLYHLPEEPTDYTPNSEHRLTPRQLFPWLHSAPDVFQTMHSPQRIAFEPAICWTIHSITDSSLTFTSEPAEKTYSFSAHSFEISYKNCPDECTILTEHTRTNKFNINNNNKKVVKLNDYYGILYKIEMNSGKISFIV